MSSQESAVGFQPGARSVRRSLPLAVLNWIELQGLKIDLSKIRKGYASQDDSWWVSCEGEPEGPVSFESALRRLVEGAPTLALLHISRAQEEPAPWIPISYRAWWSNPQIAIAWTAGFWGVCALLGWVLVSLIAPLPMRGPAQLVYWLMVAATCAHFAIVSAAGAAFRSQLGRLFSPREKREAFSPELQNTREV